MTAGTLDEVVVDVPAVLKSSALKPAALTSENVPAIHRNELECLCDSPVEGVRCMRGVVLMVALEAAAALCIYGLFHAWHLLRVAH